MQMDVAGYSQAKVDYELSGATDNEVSRTTRQNKLGSWHRRYISPEMIISKLLHETEINFCLFKATVILSFLLLTAKPKFN